MSKLSFYNISYSDNNDDIENDIEFIEIKKEIKLLDNETQTDIINNDVLNKNTENMNHLLSEIDILKSEIASLKIKNSRLEKNFKEICNLLVIFTKIDVENPEVDKIRRQLTILVNRELRMNYAFPFVSLLSNIK